MQILQRGMLYNNANNIINYLIFLTFINYTSFIIYRIFLPILRYNLPESVLSQEIPTPSRQQVAYKIIKLVEHEEKIRKEQFWFREDLFGGLIMGKGKISATWNCVNKIYIFDDLMIHYIINKMY